MRIENIEDVTRFFKYLAEERRVLFHPDDDFECYVNIETGEPTFTPDECKVYNSAMQQCFEVCEAEGVDIYLIGLETLKQ
jgi:hypothetical protein